MYILYGYIEGLGSYVTENMLYPLPIGKERTLDIVPGGTELAISGVPRGVLGCWKPPEIPKAQQKSAKLKPICENC
jgi:hypothetical protein